MKFGLMGGLGSPDTGATWVDTFRNTLDTARSIAEMGYEIVWWPADAQDTHPYTTLAQMCASDAGLELGVLYLLPFDHPVRLAAEISSLDHLSHGQLTVAVAQGWRERQFKAFGIPRRERLSRFLEMLEAMKHLWAQEQVSFQGRYYDLETYTSGQRADAAAIVSKPVQQPHPKILVAANGDRGIQRAPNIANGWLISSRSTYPAIQRQATLFKEAAQSVGQQGVIWAWREAYCAKDRKTALETIRPAVEAFYADRASLGHERDLPPEDRIGASFEEILRDRFIIGSPDDCIEEIQRYRALGIETISMRMQWEGMSHEQAWSSLRLMGAEVLPHFR